MGGMEGVASREGNDGGVDQRHNRPKAWQLTSHASRIGLFIMP